MSQVVELKPSVKIVVVFEGKEYPLKRPKMGTALEMEEQVAEARASGKGGTRLIRDMIVKAGMPAEVVDELDGEQIEQIVEALKPQKKN